MRRLMSVCELGAHEAKPQHRHRAAFVQARTLGGFSPFNSKGAAISSKTGAISLYIV
jgi:hypothetical protein